MFIQIYCNYITYLKYKLYFGFTINSANIYLLKTNLTAIFSKQIFNRIFSKLCKQYSQN